jgi:hypothetical protein
VDFVAWDFGAWAWLVECFSVLLLAMPGYPCCCTSLEGEECGQCTSGVGPAEYQIEISDIVNDGCSDPASVWNGTWIIPFFSSDTTLNPICRWRYVLTVSEAADLKYKNQFGFCFDANGEIVVLQSNNGSHYFTTIILTSESLGTTNATAYQIQHPTFAPIACMDFNGTDVPWEGDGANNHANSIAWDASGSTCLLTSL